MNLGVIIAAGGVGSRMGDGGSKQLMLLDGTPVLARTLAVFDTYPAVSEIVIAIASDDMEDCRRMVSEHGFARVNAIEAGGECRGESVLNALGALSPAVDTVAVHDGARPLFTPGMLTEGLRELAAGDCDGIAFGLPVTDTVKEVGRDNRLVLATPERSRLWASQTPQIFNRPALEKAYRAPAAVLAGATDDASLVERFGGLVKMVPGSRENIKLTEPLDLLIAGEILKRREAGQDRD
ncbi:MAG: 2-C-methyl-D-erythritol 4-phosphate cytidylyltransferase [Thermoleophilia bacterium]